MTISTTANVKTYTGDGSTVEFSFPYLFYSNDDIEVTLNNSIQLSGFSVSGAENINGGTVTFVTAPASGDSVVLRRVVSYTQDTDFENFDGNNSEVTEKQFDLLTMQAQQLAEENERSILSPIGTSISSNVITGTIDTNIRLLSMTTSGVKTVTLGSVQSEIDTTFSSLASGDLLVYNGSSWENAKLQTSSASNPTVNFDENSNYRLFSEHINTSTTEKWVCLDATAGAAVWEQGTLDSSDLGGGALLDVSSDTTFVTDTTQLRDAAAIKTHVENATSSSGKILQTQIEIEQMPDTTTTSQTFPTDNTTPQITEGKEYMTIDITPQKANSKIIIDVDIPFFDSNSNYALVAIFKDSDADAVGSAVITHYAGTYWMPMRVRVVVDAVNTTARTYKMRYGARTETSAIASILKGINGTDYYNANGQVVMTATEVAQ